MRLNARNGSRSTGTWINVDCDSAENCRPIRNLELHRHMGQKSRKNQIDLHADYGIDWPCHSQISDIGSSLGQNAFVSSLNVSVGTNNRARSAIHVPPKCLLFRCRFAVYLE